MKKVIKLTESDLRCIVENVLEGESGGWIVEPEEAEAAYNLAVRVLGQETIDRAIIRAMNNNTLADCLAYIFRMYDFKEWDEYKQSNDFERDTNF